LEAGDLVPVDLRIISAQNFLVNESALTGDLFLSQKIADPLDREEQKF